MTDNDLYLSENEFNYDSSNDVSVDEELDEFTCFEDSSVELNNAKMHIQKLASVARKNLKIALNNKQNNENKIKAKMEEMIEKEKKEKEIV